MIAPKILTYKDLDRLSVFLDKCIKNTYAVSAPKQKSCRLRSHDYKFREGPWFFHDSALGEREFGGQQIIYHEADPVWEMSYHGELRITAVPGEKIYGFLKRALLRRDFKRNLPRGPQLFKEPGKKWIYVNKCEGKLEEFRGKEYIYISGGLAYLMRYQGGLLLE